MDRQISKRPKYVIEDPVACQVFRDLGLDSRFLNSGKVLAWAVQPDDSRFLNIYDYVAHSQVSKDFEFFKFGLKILSIIRIIPNAKHSENDEFIDFDQDPESRGKPRKMLWHGTMSSSVASILENGLRLPLKDKASKFGKGIYLSDRAGYSALYSRASFFGPEFWGTPEPRYLFLCDVLLGTSCETKTWLPNITSPPKKIVGPGQAAVECESVKGLGHWVPDPAGDKEIEGSVWSFGDTIRKNYREGPFATLYNEYVVYATKQVHPQYLVKVEVTEKPYYEI